MSTVAARLFAADRGGVWFLDESGEAPFVGWEALRERALRIAGGLRRQDPT